jgi:hypothetical protein
VIRGSQWRDKEIRKTLGGIGENMLALAWTVSSSVPHHQPAKGHVDPKSNFYGGVMKKVGLSLLALGLVVSCVAGVARTFSSGIQEEKVGDRETESRITVDVAVDGRTVRFNRGITYQEAGRGDTFVIFGPIYPAGTLPTGPASNSPDDPGSIGAWTFRETLSYDGGVSRGSGLEECCGLPAVETPPLWIQLRRGKPGVVDLFKQLGLGTGHFQFDDVGTLVAEGLVGRPTGVAAVVGGMGAFSGAGGELTGVSIGTNSTGYPNLRVTFNLKKQAPK